MTQASTLIFSLLSDKEVVQSVRQQNYRKLTIIFSPFSKEHSGTANTALHVSVSEMFDRIHTGECQVPTSAFEALALVQSWPYRT